MVAEDPLRRRADRTGGSGPFRAAAAVLLSLALTVAVAVPSAAVHASVAEPASDAGPSVAIAADNGGVLGPSQALSVSVTISNGTGSPIEPGSIELWIDAAPLTTRTELATWLGGSAAPATVRVVGNSPTSLIEPGTTYTYRITATAASLPFKGRPAASTFGIGASVTSGSVVVAGAHGDVVWNPGPHNRTPATKVAVVMPITVPVRVTGIISAADLTSYTSPNGVLTRELAAAIAEPEVTLGIDPMIIASIRALNTAAPPSALQWLHQLDGVPNPTFALQYGDADPVTEVHAGATKLLAPTSLTFALDPANFKTAPTPVGEPQSPLAAPTPTATPTPGASGPQLPSLNSLLAWPYTMNGVAWPADGTVRPSDLATLSSRGLHTTIISSSNTNMPTMPVTPSAAFTAGDETAVAADSALSTAMRNAQAAQDQVELSSALADMNAQLQLISAGGQAGRTIVVTLGRQTPGNGGDLIRALGDVSSSPWARAATLQDAMSATPTADVTVKSPAEDAARTTSAGELLKSESSVDAFATVLDDPSSLIGQTRAQLLTTLGVGWEEPHNNWPGAVVQTLKVNNTALASVSIAGTVNVNLVGTQGSIPFTINNTLSSHAVTVVISASPSNNRLEIDGETTKRIEADSRSTVLVPVKAELGNGRVTLTLQLYSKTGVSIGVPANVPVEVHADWEGIGAVIVGSILVLLFGFGIVRNILRRRRRDDVGVAEGSADDDV